MSCTGVRSLLSEDRVAGTSFRCELTFIEYPMSALLHGPGAHRVGCKRDALISRGHHLAEAGPTNPFEWDEPAHLRAVQTVGDQDGRHERCGRDFP